MKFYRLLYPCLLLFGFLLWFLYEGSFAPIFTLCAILIHDAGHGVGASRLGFSSKKFSIKPWEARIGFGSQTFSYKDECIISAAGPLANLLTALVLSCIGYSFGDENALSFFFSVSISLALINLLPINEFDGGRILRCALSFFISPNATEIIGDALSFLSLFCLWCASVYLLIHTGADLSFFLFSVSLFVLKICY